MTPSETAGSRTAATPPGRPGHETAKTPSDAEATMKDRRGRRPDLSLLDPGRGDPAYWERLRAAVLSAVAFELAARRERPRLSVAGILSGWSKKLIPAALAASVAALATWSQGRGGGEAVPPPPPLALEEVLGPGAEGELSWAAQGAAANAVAFMSFVESEGR